MSKRVIFWVAVGAVVLIALTAFVWSYQHNRDAEYKAAIKAHAKSLRLIGVAHPNESSAISTATSPMTTAMPPGKWRSLN